ncbi:MAG: mannose-6-phosphate isomerase, partial [Armatimonadetes bacterium CG_4_10_14_3_um_filter_66_18]
MDPYPLLCTPLCKPKLWGGTRLAELFGKAPVAGESNIGETWEVAD